MGMIMLVTALGMVWHTCWKNYTTDRQPNAYTCRQTCTSEPSLLYTMSAGRGGNTCRQTIRYT